MRQTKYLQNLSILDAKVINKSGVIEYKKGVYSYNTLVAIIDPYNMTIKKTEWNVKGQTSSPTTSKHINYVAMENNLTLIKS